MAMMALVAVTELVFVAGPARAQLGGVLPIDPLGVTGSVGDIARDVTDDVTSPVRSALGGVRQLAQVRLDRLASYVSSHRDAVEWDDRHQPAVRGEVLLLDPDAAALGIAERAGYALIEQGSIDGLDVRYARLRAPGKMPLARAIKDLRKALPGKDISADQIHFPAGSARRARTGASPQAGLPHGGTVGIIDGGVAGSDRLAAQRGFARGAPKPSEHASAIASLLKGAGTSRIFAADVYGNDPAGGSALDIAKALGWMSAQGVPVVSISLVGPGNPLLARAIGAARGKGMVVVAAVGNDGAAAPPGYPASYPGVIAVTGVDGAGRVLIEAGRASHLDYAAPGADMTAVVPGRGRIGLRGTSFAAPLVAARIAARRQTGLDAAKALKAVNLEAIDRSARTGRGIVCNTCRTGS